MTSAERENGTPLPMQSAAGVAVIHGRITPSLTPATPGVGLAAVQGVGSLGGCVISGAYRILKLRYRQVDFRYFLGMISRSLDSKYSSIAARVVVH